VPKQLYIPPKPFTGKDFKRPSETIDWQGFPSIFAAKITE